MIGIDLHLMSIEIGNDVLEQAAEVGRIIRGLLRKLDTSTATSAE